MQNGSSEEKDSKEEAGPQDRGGEEVIGEEDGYSPSQDQEEINLQRRGARPRASFIFFPKQAVIWAQANFSVRLACLRGLLSALTNASFAACAAWRHPRRA
jgi:hypothetical protein